MISCEFAAPQAAGQSDGNGYVPAIDDRCFNKEHMAFVRTCRRTPAILSLDDRKVGGRSALLTVPQHGGTSGVVTSVHGSRENSAQVKIPPAREAERETAGMSEKLAAMEAGRRERESSERLDEPQFELAGFLRVESVRNAGAECGEQDD